MRNRQAWRVISNFKRQSWKWIELWWDDRKADHEFVSGTPHKWRMHIEAWSPPLVHSKSFIGNKTHICQKCQIIKTDEFYYIPWSNMQVNIEHSKLLEELDCDQMVVERIMFSWANRRNHIISGNNSKIKDQVLRISAKDVKPSKLMSISLRVTMSEPERFWLNMVSRVVMRCS